MTPLNFTPFDVDYVSIAKEIVFKYIDSGKYKIFIFGSRANNSNHRFSDLDIGVLGEHELPATIQLDLENELNQSRVPYKVEIVDFFNVDEDFKTHAMKNIVWINE